MNFDLFQMYPFCFFLPNIRKIFSYKYTQMFFKLLMFYSRLYLWVLIQLCIVLFSIFLTVVFI